MDRGPPAREPVAQVEGVGDRLACGVVVDPPRDRQLDQAQLLDLRRAVAADLHQPVLATPDPTTTPQLRVGSVEVGPVCGQRQIPRLGRPPFDQRTLDRRQRGGGIEVVDGEVHATSLLEHVFEHKSDGNLFG